MDGQGQSRNVLEVTVVLSELTRPLLLGGRPVCHREPHHGGELPCVQGVEGPVPS